MKEIKMRAWIKDKQEMFYNVYITPRDKITDDEWEEIGIYWVDVVMLDTWLKDKNWKKIYEGDIIKKLFYGKERTIAVEWDEDYWGFNISYWLQEWIINTDSRVIVGNIYGNPDLVS